MPAILLLAKLVGIKWVRRKKEGALYILHGIVASGARIGEEERVSAGQPGQKYGRKIVRSWKEKRATTWCTRTSCVVVIPLCSLPSALNVINRLPLFFKPPADNNIFDCWSTACDCCGAADQNFPQECPRMSSLPLCVYDNCQEYRE